MKHFESITKIPFVNDIKIKLFLLKSLVVIATITRLTLKTIYFSGHQLRAELLKEMSYNLYHNLPELARNGGFSLCDGDGKDESIDWRFIGELRRLMTNFSDLLCNSFRF